MQWHRKRLQSREMDGKWWGVLLEWTGRGKAYKTDKLKNQNKFKKKQQCKKQNKTNKQKGFKPLGSFYFIC